MIGFFGKKTSKITVDNGSSLNIPITIKIIASTKITLIDTSVLLLYLLLYYLIFNHPLLCTSCGDSKICLPSLYILIKFFPNDQNTMKIFLSINRIPVIAPILGQRKRGPFYGGVSPSKIGLIAPS
jgi:hypothetical protein